MEGANQNPGEEADGSNIFFVRRSSPPGSFPVKIKPGFSVGVFGFSLIAMFIINGVFYMMQDRVLDDVAPISEMAVGKYNSMITAFVCGADAFLFSLISTVLISYTEIITNHNKKLIYLCRFFNIFISISFILIGTVLYSDSYLVSFGLKAMFFCASILYSILLVYLLFREIELYLSILRGVLIVCAIIGFGIMVTNKPFSKYSLGSTRAIGEYILTFSLLIILLTFGKELTDIFIDVVVVTDRSKKQ